MKNLRNPAIWISLILAFAFAGCGVPTGAPPVTLRIGMYQSASLLPYYVTREQGYDKKYGLRFEETIYQGAEGVIEALVAGDLDLSISVAMMPLLLAAERLLVPDKLVPVAANSYADPTHPAVGVLAANEIRGWKDLEGKMIASNAPDSISTAAVETRAKDEGVRSYSFVQMALARLGPAVAGGSVAAAAMVEPYLTESLLRGDGRLLGWVVGGPPFEEMPFASIAVSTEFLRRNPEGVRAFLRAHLAAVGWINEHPAEARLLLARKLKLSPEIAGKFKLLRWPTDARSDPVLIDRTQQVLLRAGRLQRPVNARSLFDETLLAGVLKEKP